MSTFPPEIQLRRMANAYQISRAIQVAATLELGRLVSQGPRSAQELAQSTGTKEGTLVLLLRLLSDLDVLEELPRDRFGPTPLSDLLWQADNIAQGDEAWSAWSALPYTLRTGLPAFPRAHGQAFYDYAAAHPQKAAHWQSTNTTYSTALAPSLVDSFKLQGTETIVDIGGGQGALLAALLQRHPACRGVLFDLPEAIAGASDLLEAARVADRCRVVPGNAFEALPESADVYLLSRVLFNWTDEEALRVLTRCSETMAPSSRLLIVEALLPEPSDQRSPGFSAADLHHFLLWGGRYRARSGLSSLLGRAQLSLIEARPTKSADWVVLEARVRDGQIQEPELWDGTGS